MDSIIKIYKIGYGPSSSHTMGPAKAAALFRERYPNAALVRVHLYGSLAATGKGHLTDVAITNAFKGIPTDIIFDPQTTLARHPNAMKFEALDIAGHPFGHWTAYSIGGGDIVDDGQPDKVTDVVYPHSKMIDILGWCDNNGMQLWEYVEKHDLPELWQHLSEVWNVMKESIRRGLENEGVLPGVLKLPRKAASYLVKGNDFRDALRRRSKLYAYALAVAEENAAGGLVVTAPTCGSCGVLPAVLYSLQQDHEFPDIRIYRALATAGLIGNLVKVNASVSGAEVGCQGEIGTACSMAAAAAAQLFGGTPYEIEYAAEMGLEHHLGLTCDPIAGLVQIPCIERNAFAAARALDAVLYAIISDGRHRVSFDKVVVTMKQTGKDLPSLYRETSEGGLAVENKE